MRKTFQRMLILLSIVLMTGMLSSCDSHERRIARFEKTATEFKSSLDRNEVILTEVVDSVIQKVYYAELCGNYEGIAYSGIKVHNYATNKTGSAVSASTWIEDYYFGGDYGECFEITDTKLFDNRFFIITWTEKSERGIFYIDIRDDSLHFVEECAEARFSKQFDEIVVSRACFVNGKMEYREHEISMSLDDEAYLINRKKQREKDRRFENDVKERDISEWIFGTWDWTGYIFGNKTWNRLRISSQDIESSSPDGILDNGKYTIDLENNTIHFGKCSYVKFDYNKKILYFDDDEPYRKVSNTLQAPPVTYGSDNSNNRNNYSEVRFGTDAEVIVYTGSHLFKNGIGNRIKINFQGMYLNGNLVTNAPKVLSFNGSGAVISVSSPYNGGGAMILTVDALHGTITDGSGDVFRIVD